ncbi:MAG: TolC family protein [Bryobacteraceae bacterium]|nr:TolC family protein [Bryobacteraceae bacterium]
MIRLILAFCGVSAGFALGAETTTLTLKQAVDLALRQNPDIAIARLDEMRAALDVEVVKEPLLPRVYAGSGLAYSNGFPMSIDGGAPSIVQAKATRTLFSRTQGLQVAQARETAHGARYGSAAVREDVALRTATLFLDLEKTARQIELAARQGEGLQRVEAQVRLRVEEGKEKEIEGRRAALNVARSRQRSSALESQRKRLSESLATVLGMDLATRIVPANEERPRPALPAGEDASVQAALNENPELRKLESDIAARNLQVRGFRAMRYPKVDLVAQYGLFAKFNNYTDYFRTFQRNNGQIGLSIAVPIFSNSQDEAQAAQAAIDSQKLQAELVRARGRVEAETRQSWQEIQQAGTAEEIARMDLDLAREQTSTLLVQLEEGKVTSKDVELSRYVENERLMQLDEAASALERARFQLLKETRMLVAALR